MVSIRHTGIHSLELLICNIAVKTQGDKTLMKPEKSTSIGLMSGPALWPLPNYILRTILYEIG